MSRFWERVIFSCPCLVQHILVQGCSVSGVFGNRYFSIRYLAAQKQSVLQEIERLLAEETISELRSTSGGMAPPLLLDVAYIEALPRDHLTKVEEREVKARISFACFP